MNEISKRFADSLRAARNAAGLSQDQVAERAGMSRVSVANYESGQHGASLEHAVLLASVLGFSLDSLKDGERTKRIASEAENLAPRLKELILKTIKE